MKTQNVAEKNSELIQKTKRKTKQNTKHAIESNTEYDRTTTKNVKMNQTEHNRDPET